MCINETGDYSGNNNAHSITCEGTIDVISYCANALTTGLYRPVLHKAF